MATAKKPTTKKTTAKKPVVKTTTTKKVVAAKTAPKKVTAVKAKKVAKVQSFKLSNETGPFVSFRVTEQTVYWSILLIYIMLLVLWISNIQLETMRIIETIK